MSLIPQPAKALEIFYAYEHKDHEWRDLLEAHLSGLRRQGLITGWYDRNISAGKTWSHEIDSHLATADIILLLISSDFLASEYCYCVEMTRAMERHHTGEARVIPIILRPTDWQGTPFEQLRVLPNNTQPVSRWQDHDEAMLDVVGGIKKVIEEINEASFNQLSTSNSPINAPIYHPLWNIPYNRNPFFTGREDILTRLHDTFMTGKATSSIQAISGLGGIGKTQIAIEYAYRYHNDYRAIFWIRADSHEILISDFVNIAVLLNLPQKNRQDQNQVADAVKRWLQSNSAWLLIFDNAEDLVLIREYIPAVNKGHILLTTRSRVMRRIARTIEIEKLRPEEGALFLLRWANIIAIDAPFSQATVADRAKASEISLTMDGLPLALDQAGAYIEETACSLSDYLELYRKHGNLLLKRRGNVALDHPEPVSTTWSYSFDKIQQMNPAAAELLRFCSFLHPDAIPEEIIVEGAPELGPILYPVAIDSFALNDAIGDLLKFSLLQRNSESKTLTIHRLVQAVIKAGMADETQRIWAERTTRAVNRSLPDVDLGLPQLYQRCLPHAQLCIALIEQWNMVFTEAAQLLYQIGYYFRKYSQHDQAEPLYQKALTIYEQLLGPNHTYIANILDHLASLYKDLGQYEQARSFYQKALVLSEQMSDVNYSSRATILNNLAQLYQLQDNFGQAESYYKLALTSLEQNLSPEHPYIVTILEGLIALYQTQGKHEQADSLRQRLRTIYKQALRLELAG